MNYCSLSDDDLKNHLRQQLESADDDKLFDMFHDMKTQGLQQKRVYDCMCRLIEEYRLPEDDALLDRLYNWIDMVSSNVAPQCWIWDQQI
jgi:hypothetical protein